MKTNSSDNFKVGDVVVPADGSEYRGVIVFISKEENTIIHQNLRTGVQYEKSYNGFWTRYMLESERMFGRFGS